jgi:hypothetical protein
MDGTMVQGVFIDKAIEVLLQCTGDFAGSTGSGTIPQALDSFIGKAVDPLAESGIGTLERVGDRLQTGTFDDFTDRLGAPEDSGLFRLLQHSIQGWKGVIGQVKLEGPHGMALPYKVLQKYEHVSPNIVRLFSYQSKTFSTRIFQELLITSASEVKRCWARSLSYSSHKTPESNKSDH